MPSSLALAMLVVAATTVSAAGHSGVVLARLLEVQQGFKDEDGAAPSQATELADLLGQGTELADLLGQGAIVAPIGCSCSAASLSCQCCANINIPKFQFAVCAVVAYDPHGIGFVFKLTLNGRVLYQKLTVHNPPPLCVGLPGVKLAQLCVHFYNLDWDSKHISGCAGAQTKLAKFAFAQSELGCFNLGPFSENVEENALPASGESPAVLLPAVTKPADVSPDASDTLGSAPEAGDSFVLKFRPGMSEKAMSQLLQIIRQLQAIDLAFSVSVSVSFSLS